jgi:carbon-monoxide dehydrogenase medium subunit
LKAPAFDYVRARSLPEALSLVQQHGEAAKIIAGGQSLVPALNLRLVTPALLVDIGGLAELKGISIGDGVVRVGALTRHVDLQRSPEIAKHAPLIAQAVAHIAHPAVRNRGTIGGSLAQADPAAELPACALALQAQMVIAGPQGERRVAAQDFFRGVYETVLAPHDLLVALEFPAIRPGERSAFLELVRRSGDYALVGLACHAALADGALRELRLAYFGIGVKPTLAVNAAKRLVGTLPSDTSIADAQAALAQDLKPQDDIHASAATRRQLARVLLRRTLAELLPETAVAERKRA